MALLAEPHLPAQRQEVLYQLLRERRFASVRELAELLGVSEMTVRRDLRLLERMGRARRVFGGAQLAEPQSALEESYQKRLQQNREAKEAIARMASGLVAKGDTVALDGSTTALYLARELKGRRVTVVTNSLLVAEALAGSEAQVLLLGGELRSLARTLVGPWAERLLEGLHLDKAFFSAKGLTAQGLLDAHLEEVAVKRRMLERAGQRIALVDGSKFGVRALHTLCRLEEIDGLVTDAEPPEEVAALLREARVTLWVAGGSHA